jgi:hypothetical protein
MDLYNEVVRGAVDPIRAHNRFIHYHKDTLLSLTRLNKNTSFNFFLPPERGGLGMENLALEKAKKIKVTSFQRRFASFLMEKYLESVATHDDPGKGPLGLVQKTKTTSALSIRHRPPLHIIPLYGPLRSTESIHKPKLYFPPALALNIDPERPELTVRLPKKSTMTKFRSKCYQRMSTKDIMFWPYRLAEEVFFNQKETPALVPLEGFETVSYGEDLWSHHVNWDRVLS